MDISSVVGQLLASPVALALLIVIGAVLIVTPLSLRLAGLSGEQIRSLLESTMEHVVETIKEFRTQNASKP